MSDIRITWWNLENFFDTDDDPISKDFQYTPEHGWTPEAFAAKRDNLAAALNATHEGQGPDLLAVCEIEKDALLADLIRQMGRNRGANRLKVVLDPAGTSDLRGIDVAMAYNADKLEVVTTTSHVVHLRYATRDLFEVRFRTRDPQPREFVVIAGHWPSRYRGRERTAPLRAATAEHVAYLVREHVRVDPRAYEALRDADDLAPVLERWETPVVIVGDLNDQPFDRSLVDHLQATGERERVEGPTNSIDHFEEQTADYRGDDTFLFNPMWRFLTAERTGSYFISGNRSGEAFPDRYQVLDQLIVSRGLLSGNQGITLVDDSVQLFADPLVATGSGRPRGFNRRTGKGTSDHLPVTAVLRGA